MSKNIYRVNKKSDVDIIFKNNLLKPIFLIFVDNKTDTKLVDEIEKTLLVLSKKNTYGVSLLINFDKFVDEMNFFNQYKENTPSFVSFFLGQQITEHLNEDNSNFISIIVSIVEKIHSNYVSKLNILFTANTTDEHTPPPPPFINPSTPNNSSSTALNNSSTALNNSSSTALNNSTTALNTPFIETNVPAYVNEELQMHVIKNSDDRGGGGDRSGGDRGGDRGGGGDRSGGDRGGGNASQEGSDNDTDEIRLKKEKLKLLLKQKELLEINKSN